MASDKKDFFKKWHQERQLEPLEECNYEVLPSQKDTNRRRKTKETVQESQERRSGWLRKLKRRFGL